MEIPTTVKKRTWDPATGDTTFTEVPFKWSGELSTVYKVVGLAVRSFDNGTTGFVVTSFVEDEHSSVENPPFDENKWRSLRTAGIEFPWFDQLPTTYRGLLRAASDGYYDKHLTAIRSRSARLDVARGALKPGQMILLTRSRAWGDTADGRVVGVPVSNVEQLDTDPVDPIAEIARLGLQKARLARQLVRSFEKRERIVMAAVPRIEPDTPMRPFENNDTGAKTERLVYGGGVAMDHYVDFAAVMHHPRSDGLPGELRFTSEGWALLVPHIMPLGEGSDNDPLCELRIHIHSDTVHNPAVGEQQVEVIIDGVTYEALVNPELSSHIFKEPGHDVFFNEFRRAGDSHQTVWLTDEQVAVVDEFESLEHELVMRGIGARDITWVPSTDPSGRAELFAQVDEEMGKGFGPGTKKGGIIQSIIDAEPNGTSSAGARILVPESQLDSVEIRFLPNIA